MLQLARESDWEDVRRLSVQVHNLHVSWRPDLYVHCEEPYPKEVYLEDIRKRMVYVAKLENQVMGYVVLAVKQKDGPGRVPRKILLLETICVEETIRGHGIGKEMLMDVRALSKAFGCAEVMLGVHPENEIALGFYQKCGFQINTINMQIKN